MKPQAKVMGSYLLSPQIVSMVELYAQRGRMSTSEAIEQLLTKCSEMVVTGVVEEVTEKDVFEDINKELKDINDRLKSIDEWQEHIYDEVTS